MFNIFKNKSEKIEYPEIVQEIHNEFEGASEKLLQEATRAVEELKGHSVEKGKRLASLGFGRTKEAVQAVEVEKKKELSKEIIELVSYYRKHYPNNKFITDDMVTEICNKYDLICGDTDRYMGFVPEAKLELIERFNLRKTDCADVFRFGYTEQTKRGWVAQCGEEFFTRYVKRDNDVVSKINLPLQICAPLKDMDTSGMRIENRRLVREIPDPVVLQPVHGGYLIICAWGDEASDPIVVNETMN